MPLTDEDAAMQAIKSLDSPSEPQIAASVNITRLLHGENDSPFVDVQELFRLYDTLYFRALLGQVECLWSPRLTLCAGICELIKDSRGRYRRVRLKLSEPLLRYRPKEDTVNTLLHEAIHAYFFVTSSWRHARSDDNKDPSGHGAGFQMLASAINHHSGYDITIYHTFHDEVDNYRTHIWQCNGPCRDVVPHFGLVKRSMNRAPGRNDYWFSKHSDECGGSFSKISEPDPSKAQLKNMSSLQRAGLQKNKLDSWMNKRVSPSQNLSEANGKYMPHSSEKSDSTNNVPPSTKRKCDNGPDLALLSGPDRQHLVSCPICDCPVPETRINSHLDEDHLS